MPTTTKKATGTTFRLELARVLVQYTTVEVPTCCPDCGADFASERALLREVNYAESSFRGCVFDTGVEAHFDVDAETSLNEAETPWHPIRYECAACGLVLADGAELVDSPADAVPA